ncbi:uncharacterized protein [Haliotis asinina]|uniref:uncharacterized protein n=1 Tax=Haliotis asinina TaxID=109174 RepID=UPI003531B4CD
MFIAGNALFLVAVVVSVITAEDISACKLLSEKDTQGTLADRTGSRLVANLSECEAECLMNDTCFAAEFRRDTMLCNSYSNDTTKTLEKGVTFLTKVCLGNDPDAGNGTDVTNTTSVTIQPSGTVASVSYIADMLDPSATDMQDFASLASAFPHPPSIDHLESMANATFGDDWANNSSMSNDSLPSVEVAATMNISDGSDSMIGVDGLSNGTDVSFMNGSFSMKDPTDSMEMNGTLVDSANETHVESVFNGTIDVNADGNASLGISPSATVPGQGSDEAPGASAGIMPSHTAGISIELPIAASTPQGGVTPGIESVGYTVVTGPSATMDTKVQVSASSSADAKASVSYTFKPTDVTKPQVKDDTTAPQTPDIIIFDTTVLPPKTTLPPTTKPATRQQTDSATTTSVPSITTAPPVAQPQNPYNPYQPYNPYNPYGNPQVPPQARNQPPQVPPYSQPNPQYPPYPNPQYPQFPQYQPNPQYPQYPPYPYGPRYPQYPQYPQYPPYGIPPQVPPQPQVPVYQIPKATNPPVSIEEKRLCFNRDKFPDLKLPEEKPKLFLIPSGETGKYSVVAVPTRHNPVICFPVSYRGKVPILHLPAQNSQPQYNPYNQQLQFPFQYPGFPYQNVNQNPFLPGATVPVPIDIKTFLNKYGDIYSATTSPKTTVAGDLAHTTPSTPDKDMLGSNDTVGTNSTVSQSVNITGTDGNSTFTDNQGFVNQTLGNNTMPDLNINLTIPEMIMNSTDQLANITLTSNSTIPAPNVNESEALGNGSFSINDSLGGDIQYINSTSFGNSSAFINASNLNTDAFNQTESTIANDTDVQSNDTVVEVAANLIYSNSSDVSLNSTDTVLGNVTLSRTVALQTTTPATITESHPPRRVRPSRYGRFRPVGKKPHRNRPKKKPKSKPKRKRRPRPTLDPEAQKKGKHPMRYARRHFWRRRKNPRQLRHPSSVSRKYRSRRLRSQK